MIPLDKELQCKCKTKTIQTDLGTFRHIQAYSKPCVNLAYSEP